MQSTMPIARGVRPAGAKPTEQRDVDDGGGVVEGALGVPTIGAVGVVVAVGALDGAGDGRTGGVDGAIDGAVAAGRSLAKLFPKQVNSVPTKGPLGPPTCLGTSEHVPARPSNVMHAVPGARPAQASSFGPTASACAGRTEAKNDNVAANEIARNRFIGLIETQYITCVNAVSCRTLFDDRPPCEQPRASVG
jgi:hypothetical protein